MAEFDPTQFGAVAVEDEPQPTPAAFDPTAHGAIPVQEEAPQQASGFEKTLESAQQGLGYAQKGLGFLMNPVGALHKIAFPEEAKLVEEPLISAPTATSVVQALQAPQRAILKAAFGDTGERLSKASGRFLGEQVSGFTSPESLALLAVAPAIGKLGGIRPPPVPENLREVAFGKAEPATPMEAAVEPVATEPIVTQPPIQEIPNAIEPSNAQVEAGQTAQRVQERTGSDIATTGSGDNALGEAQGAAEPRQIPARQGTEAQPPQEQVAPEVLGKQEPVAPDLPTGTGEGIRTSIKTNVGDLPITDPTDNVTDTLQGHTNTPAGARIEYLPINDVTGSITRKPQVEKLTSEMSGEGGHISRLIVDSQNNVVEGQHRLEALRNLGATEVPVVKIFGAEDFIPDVGKVKQAIKDSGITHSDQVNQMMSHLGEALLDENGNVAELKNYDAPQGFEKPWNAAITEIERQKPPSVSVEGQAPTASVKPETSATGAVGAGEALAKLPQSGDTVTWSGKDRTVSRTNPATNWVFFEDGTSARLSPKMTAPVPKAETLPTAQPLPKTVESVTPETPAGTGISNQRLTEAYGDSAPVATTGKGPGAWKDEGLSRLDRFQKTGDVNHDPYSVLTKLREGQTTVSLPSDVSLLRAEHQRLLEDARNAEGTPEYAAKSQAALDMATAIKDVAHGPASDVFRALQEYDKPRYDNVTDFDQALRERENRESTVVEKTQFKKMADDVASTRNGAEKEINGVQKRMSKLPKMEFDEAAKNIRDQFTELLKDCVL